MKGSFEKLFGPWRGGIEKQEQALKAMDSLELADTRRRILAVLDNFAHRESLDSTETRTILTHIEWADETGNRDLGDRGRQLLARLGPGSPDGERSH